MKKRHAFLLLELCFALMLFALLVPYIFSWIRLSTKLTRQARATLEQKGRSGFLLIEAVLYCAVLSLFLPFLFAVVTSSITSLHNLSTQQEQWYEEQMVCAQMQRDCWAASERLLYDNKGRALLCCQYVDKNGQTTQEHVAWYVSKCCMRRMSGQYDCTLGRWRKRRISTFASSHEKYALDHRHDQIVWVCGDSSYTFEKGWRV